MIARAPLEEVAAFMWDYTSRTNEEITQDDERVSVNKKGKEWEKEVMRRQKVELKQRIKRRRNRVNAREYHHTFTLTKITTNCIILTLKPLIQQGRKKSPKTILASSEIAIKLTREGGKGNKTLVETYLAISLGSKYLKGKTVKLLLERHLEEQADIGR